MDLRAITPLILTYNEEPNIHRVLDRLRWADRIVIVDSFSTDRTLEIARRYPNVLVFPRYFDSFAEQWNFGLRQVQTEWVLSLDADYLCTPALADELRALPDDPAEDGFEATFQYCVFGRPLRGTLYPPRTVLFRKDLAVYEQDGHTQRIRVYGPVGRLNTSLFHDDRKPLESWFAAQQRYAADEARKLTATPAEELGFVDRLRKSAWLVPILVPFYCLFVKGGIFDGRAGWYYAMQRTLAELALALTLLDGNRNVVVKNAWQRFNVASPALGDGETTASFPHDISQIVVTVSG